MAIEVEALDLRNIFPLEKFSVDDQIILHNVDYAARTRIKKMFDIIFSSASSSISGLQFFPPNDNLANFSGLYDHILKDIKVYKLWAKSSAPLKCAIYVWFLHLINLYLRPEDFKYSTISSFRQMYAGNFDSESSDTEQRLWQTANWMNVFFLLVPSRHNKCLAMAVVPKFLEGWEAEYTRGGGATSGTRHRDTILRKERESLQQRLLSDTTSYISHSEHHYWNEPTEFANSSSSSSSSLSSSLVTKLDFVHPTPPFRCEEDPSFIDLLPSVEEEETDYTLPPISLDEIFKVDEEEQVVTATSPEKSSSSSSSSSVTLDTLFLFP